MMIQGENAVENSQDIVVELTNNREKLECEVSLGMSNSVLFDT